MTNHQGFKLLTVAKKEIILRTNFNFLFYLNAILILVGYLKQLMRI